MKKLILSILFFICSPVFALNNVYYSVSPFGTGDIKVACNISISGGAGVATFSVAQTGNIGQGCHVISAGVDGYISVMTNSTTATIVTALGAAHGNVSSEALTSIAHEWAALATAENEFTNASHVNNTDLTAADILVNLVCYYDHDDQTADTTKVSVNYGTDDATRYVNIYTPTGGTQSINNQRATTPAWDGNKYKLVTSTAPPFEIKEGFTRFDGIQIEHAGTTTFTAGVNLANLATTGGVIYIEHSNIRQSGAAADNRGIYMVSATVATTVNINNTIVTTWSAAGARGLDADFTTNFRNCTIYNNGAIGIQQSNGTLNVKNSAVFLNTDDFSGTIGHTTNADDDGDSTQTLDATSNYANEFVDVVNGDFTLVSNGVCEENGTDLSGEGISDDYIGTSRPVSTNYDIGVYEGAVAGGSAFIPKIILW